MAATTQHGRARIQWRRRRAPKLDGHSHLAHSSRSLAPTVIRVIVTITLAVVAVAATAAVTLYALLVIDSRDSVRHYYGDTPAPQTPEHGA